MKIRWFLSERNLKQGLLKFHRKFWSLKFVKGSIRQELHQNCTHSRAVGSVSMNTVKIETHGSSQYPEMVEGLFIGGCDSILRELDSVDHNQQTQQHYFRLGGITIYTAYQHATQHRQYY
jgi:hypothetical protein